MLEVAGGIIMAVILLLFFTTYSGDIGRALALRLGSFIVLSFLVLFVGGASILIWQTVTDPLSLAVFIFSLTLLLPAIAVVYLNSRFGNAKNGVRYIKLKLKPAFSDSSIIRKERQLQDIRNIGQAMILERKREAENYADETSAAAQSFLATEFETSFAAYLDEQLVSIYLKPAEGQLGQPSIVVEMVDRHLVARAWVCVTALSVNRARVKIRYSEDSGPFSSEAPALGLRRGKGFVRKRIIRYLKDNPQLIADTSGH
jgi:hypothetical protein